MPEPTRTYLGPWRLLPCAPGVCPLCATDHAPDQPHNAQSLYYQYRFYAEHGRWPNWDDALLHCDDKTKALWLEALTAAGVDLDNGKINP